MLNPAQKAYVKHLVVRKSDRETTLSDAQYAEVIGVHPNTLKKWRNTAEFQDAFKKALEEWEMSGDYFKTCVRHRILEQGLVEHEKAKGALKLKWWQALSKETSDAFMATDTIDYTQASDGELKDMCIARGAAPLDASWDEFLAMLEAPDEGGE